MHILEALIAGGVISAASYLARFLTASGAVATFLLAVPIYGLGGWQWTIPILVFFVSSSLLSHLKSNRKQNLSDVFQKSSRRDAGQVIANGGLAAVLVLLWSRSHHEAVYLAYLGAVSAVTADTWATELGVLSKEAPRLITTLARTPKGTSGGVTALGLTAGVFGSTLLFLSAYPWLEGVRDQLGSLWAAFSVIVSSGMSGNLVDSLFGASLQAQYQCATCGKITERRVHCLEASSNLIRGKKWMTNDVVNFVCSSVGAAVALLATML